MQTFFFILETVGIVAFSVSGTLAAIDNEADIFGCIFLSLITSFGGGMIRDLLIDRTPSFFTSYFHIACACITCLTVFIIAAIFKKQYIKNEWIVDNINNYFDAIGLGIFSVTGAKICIDSGFDSALVAVSLGMITSFGGGMIRDLCLRKIPFVLNKRVYAVASMTGALVFCLLFKYTSAPEYISLLCGFVLVFVIRVLATIFKLNMPKAIIFQKEQKSEDARPTVITKN